MKPQMIGLTFGRLLVIRELAVDNGGNQTYLVRCECNTERTVRGCNLRNGNTKSCRCTPRHLVHGESIRGRRTPEYGSWANMICRCEWPKQNRFHNYGGRGIKVCGRWRGSYQAFLSDMGRKPSPKHSLDRVNNNGDYTPSNCRWGTAKQQANNRRPRST